MARRTVRCIATDRKGLRCGRMTTDTKSQLCSIHVPGATHNLPSIPPPDAPVDIEQEILDLLKSKDESLRLKALEALQKYWERNPKAKVGAVWTELVARATPEQMREIRAMRDRLEELKDIIRLQPAPPLLTPEEKFEREAAALDDEPTPLPLRTVTPVDIPIDAETGLPIPAGELGDYEPLDS